jgi:hypothetical protein
VLALAVEKDVLWCLFCQSKASQQVHQQLHNRHNIINLDVVINFSMKPRLVGVDSTGFPAVQGDPPSDVPGQMPNLLLNLGWKTEFA